MFDQVTRRLTPEISVEKTVRLSPEWLKAQLAGDRKDGESASDDVNESTTTRKTSFEAPTIPTEQPDFSTLITSPNDERDRGEAAHRRRDLQASLVQFARFGWERRRPEDELDSSGITRADLEGGNPRSQFLREFLAIHQRCTDGLSVTDIAAANSRYIESSTQHFITKLALSYWDVYEIVGVRDDTFTLSSRFDSRLRVVRGLSLSLEPGDVVVARLVDVGCGWVASSVVVPTHAQQSKLHDWLCDAFKGRSWSGFMRNLGARIVFRWVVALL